MPDVTLDKDFDSLEEYSMNKYIAPLTLLTVLLSAMARGDESTGFYTELDALYFASPGDFDSEQTFGVTLGYDFNSKHALELEAQINGLDAAQPGYDVDADLISYLVGYRYNGWQRDKYTLFMGLGVGYSNAEFNIRPTEETDDSVFMGFVRIGAAMALTEQLNLSAELRYQHIDDVESDGTKFEIGGVPVVGLSLGYSF